MPLQPEDWKLEEEMKHWVHKTGDYESKGFVFSIEEWSNKDGSQNFNWLIFQQGCSPSVTCKGHCPTREQAEKMIEWSFALMSGSEPA